MMLKFILEDNVVPLQDAGIGTSIDSFYEYLLKASDNFHLYDIHIMIRLTGPYRSTDQLSVWYISDRTKCTDIWYRGAYQCIACTCPLSDWYIPPVLSGMSRYDEP